MNIGTISTGIVELKEVTKSESPWAEGTLNRTIMSSLPNSQTARSTAARTSASFATSALVEMAFTFGYRSEIILTTFSALARLISTRRTFAPSDANRIDDSNPIPLSFRVEKSVISEVQARGTYDPAPVTRAACFRRKGQILKVFDVIGQLLCLQGVQAFSSIADVIDVIASEGMR